MKAYLNLIKFNLSFLVVFSYIVSYLLASEKIFDWAYLSLLSLAGLAVVGAGNAMNQLVEYKTDRLMSRTKKRPLVTGALSFTRAKIFITVSLVLGVVILFYFFNLKSALLSLFSFFLYVYVYTPMKKYSSFAVFVGAIPGSLPCLIGWVAATDSFDIYGWVLFAIQFFWQFPHFWSLAWIVNDDYAKASYRLLPFGLKPGKIVAFQTFAFSLLMTIVSLLPYFLGVISVTAVYIILLCNALLLYRSILLILTPDTKRAKGLMLTCYIYLPVLLLSLLLFKL